MIKSTKTIKEIDGLTDLLLKKLQELKIKKIEQGLDVSAEYDNLKLKFEMIKQRKQQIIEEIDNTSIIQPESMNNKLIKDQKDKIFKHIIKEDSIENFDILFLFHSFDINQPDNLFSYLSHKVQKHDRVRFAIGYYTNSDKIFYMSKFRDSSKEKKEFLKKTFKDCIELRSDIINLDWEQSQIDVLKANYDCFFQPKTTKIVYNFAKKCWIFQDSKIADFMIHKDPVKDLLDYQKINFQLHFLNNSYLNKENIDYITSDVFLLKSISEMKKKSYLKKLYFLKRNLYDTFDEYLKDLNENNLLKKYNLKLYEDLNLSDMFKFKSFKKDNMFSKFTDFKIEKFHLKCSDDIIINQARSLFKKSANVEKITFWLEILESENSLKRIIDIHLTAKSIIDDFNNFKNDSISFEIASLYQILNSSKYIICLASNQLLNLSEINVPNKQMQDALDCLSHFSYEASNRSFVLFDLRPIEIRTNKFMLTEPIIFSLIPKRFSSSDLGLDGIEHFKNEHECNLFCKELKLNKLHS